MTKITLAVANGNYSTNSLPFSSQRCINGYPLYAENAAYNDRAVIGTDGVKSVTTTGVTITGTPRGDTVVNGILYRVSGTTLYSISKDLVVTSIGTIASTEIVSFANNGTYLVLCVPGGNSYTYNTDTSTLAQITNFNFIVSDSVSFVDGRFVFTATNGAIFFISDLNDPTSYDALNFGTAEASPDKIVAGVINHNELFIFGTNTVEGYQNAGISGFPFVRIPGALIEKGLHARNGTLVFDNTIMFIGGGFNESTAIWRITSSSSAQKVSTNAIDQVIQSFTADEISDLAFSTTYSKDGSFFAVFTFKSVGDRIPAKTLVYNATSSAMAGFPVWHEQRSGEDEGRWAVGSIALAYGRHYVSNYTSGALLGYLDNETYTDFGESDGIVREVITQPFAQENKSVFYSSLEITMETGVGLTTGQGVDPQIRMSYSDDGGRIWSNETSRTMGKIGEYRRRVLWRGSLGYAPTSRMFKFVVSDPIKFVIIKLEVYAGVGTR